MKKYLVILLCCFMLVGCGKKIIDDKPEPKVEETKSNQTLTCKKSAMASSIPFVTEMSYYYENSKIVKLGVMYVYDLSGVTEEQRNNFDKAKLCETDSVKTNLGMSECKEGFQGTDYIVTGYADKLLQQATGTIDLVKKSYESDDWECTIK